MPELKTESGETIHFSYTKAGMEAYKKRKEAEAKKKKAKSKKKKPVSKKKKAAPKKKAYRTGGLEGAATGAAISRLATAKRNLASTQVNPAHARWLKRKAKLRNMFPNTPDGNRKLRKAIGPEPSKTK